MDDISIAPCMYECVSHILTFSPTPLSLYIHIIITSCKIEMIWIGNNIQSNRRFSGNTLLKTSILKARTLRYGRKTSNTIHVWKSGIFRMNVCVSECEWRNAIVKWLPLLYDEWFGIWCSWLVIWTEGSQANSIVSDQKKAKKWVTISKSDSCTIFTQILSLYAPEAIPTKFDMDKLE